jgi:hypothetical protein
MNVHGPAMQMPTANSSSPKNMPLDYQMRGVSNIQRASQAHPVDRQIGPDSNHPQIQQHHQNQNNQFRSANPNMMPSQQLVPTQGQSFQGGLQTNMGEASNNNQARVPQQTQF